MSIYSVNETGTGMYRTRFNLSHRKLFDTDFGKIVPAMAKFVLPGDVWKCGANLLIRYQPMLAPPLTRAWARMRYFFVPLRLVEPITEQVITGSKNGKLIETSLPVFAQAFDEVDSSIGSFSVSKYSFYDYLGIPCMDYTNIWKNKCIPAAYWLKAYERIWFDYYRDENLNNVSDFDSSLAYVMKRGGEAGLRCINLHKDYFTSALPFQLKGVAPTISITGGHADFTNVVSSVFDTSQDLQFAIRENSIGTGDTTQDQNLIDTLNRNVITGVGSINMDDLRTMAAQTRVFERLARCGSRYTEYLRSNFPNYPADDTLQRAQYLGGFKQPIVTTEVVQTGIGDSEQSTPVGTLRGHGISNGGNTIKPFVAKEFGVIMGLLDISPEIMYTQGIDRELTYTSRFDFFNPSFQHLSEQEIRNGEVFISNSDNENDNTFGFQAIYNELRTSRDLVVGDLRDTLSYWTQAIKFGNRPHLNEAFITSDYYLNNFKEPFAVQDDSVKPIIVDCGNILDVYRPMVKYGTPGLVDHL